MTAGSAKNQPSNDESEAQKQSAKSDQGELRSIHCCPSHQPSRFDLAEIPLKFCGAPILLNQRCSPVEIVIQQKDLAGVDQHSAFRHDRIVEEIKESSDLLLIRSDHNPIRWQPLLLSERPQTVPGLAGIEREHQYAVGSIGPQARCFRFEFLRQEGATRQTPRVHRQKDNRAAAPCF